MEIFKNIHPQYLIYKKNFLFKNFWMKIVKIVFGWKIPAKMCKISYEY